MKIDSSSFHFANILETGFKRFFLKSEKLLCVNALHEIELFKGSVDVISQNVFLQGLKVSFSFKFVDLPVVDDEHIWNEFDFQERMEGLIFRGHASEKCLFCQELLVVWEISRVFNVTKINSSILVMKFRDTIP